MASAALTSFTPTVFFERVNGAFPQVLNADVFGAPALHGSLHQGRIANVDEVYAMWTDFGLLGGDGKRKGGSQGTSPVNEYAGVLNRFLQFGESGRATKTSGSNGLSCSAQQHQLGFRT
eukprot:10417897-Lingulodinium_polyedra.AAC.1